MGSKPLVEFLIKLETLQNNNVIIAQFQQLLAPLSLSTEIQIHKQGVSLTLIGESLSLSLIWLPNDQDYSPQIAGISEPCLVNINLKTYKQIWSAFNATSHKIWRLPPLQRRILELLCQGKSLEEIAIECNLSVPSIKRYAAIIRKTFAAKTNAQAIFIAIRHGWI